MRAFKNYLKAQNYRESTINGHQANVERFRKWSEKAGIDYEKADYNDLLKFIEEARLRGLKKSSINNHLGSIRKYYDYLQKLSPEGDEIPIAQRIGNNPAGELRLKNRYRKVLQNPLSTEELEAIYKNWQSRPAWEFRERQHKEIHERNGVILGLLAFQGLKTGELEKLEKSYVNLSKGTIYIPSTGRSNSRELPLHVLQILPLQNYLNREDCVRPPAEKGEKLFSCTLKTVLEELIKRLRAREDKAVRNAQQIRSSVIVNWLKKYNIRQVQYMAGHKHIGSTEKYKEEDLRDLQRQVNECHPLR